ncbi:MAG: hypothetical protein R3298_06080 [Gammaproteobacteria bacterium]|nr:hypothetical protein [Gammaproteobacteria bacterium]
MRPRGIGQKMALLCAWTAYAAAVVALMGSAWWAGSGETADPVFAALAASAVFFTGCGIVLHVIGKADLPELRIGGDP